LSWTGEFRDSAEVGATIAAKSTKTI